MPTLVITKGQQQLRAATGHLKVLEVASKLGVDESYASRLLSGERRPGAVLRTKILEAFGIRPELFEEVIRRYRTRPRPRRVVSCAPGATIHGAASGGAR